MRISSSVSTISSIGPRLGRAGSSTAFRLRAVDIGCIIGVILLAGFAFVGPGLLVALDQLLVLSGLVGLLLLRVRTNGDFAFIFRGCRSDSPCRRRPNRLTGGRGTRLVDGGIITAV